MNDKKRSLPPALLGLLAGLFLVLGVSQPATAADLPPNFTPISEPIPGANYEVDMHMACQITYPDETPWEVFPWNNTLVAGQYGLAGFWSCWHVPLGADIVNSQLLGPIAVQRYCDAKLGRGTQAEPKGEWAAWVCRVPWDGEPFFDSVTGLA